MPRSPRAPSPISKRETQWPAFPITTSASTATATVVHAPVISQRSLFSPPRHRTDNNERKREREAPLPPLKDPPFPPSPEPDLEPDLEAGPGPSLPASFKNPLPIPIPDINVMSRRQRGDENEAEADNSKNNMNTGRPCTPNPFPSPEQSSSSIRGAEVEGERGGRSKRLSTFASFEDEIGTTNVLKKQRDSRNRPIKMTSITPTARDRDRDGERDKRSSDSNGQQQQWQEQEQNIRESRRNAVDYGGSRRHDRTQSQNQAQPQPQPRTHHYSRNTTTTFSNSNSNSSQPSNPPNKPLNRNSTYHISTSKSLAKATTQKRKTKTKSTRNFWLLLIVSQLALLSLAASIAVIIRSLHQPPPDEVSTASVIWLVISLVVFLVGLGGAIGLRMAWRRRMSSVILGEEGEGDHGDSLQLTALAGEMGVSDIFVGGAGGLAEGAGHSVDVQDGPGVGRSASTSSRATAATGLESIRSNKPLPRLPDAGDRVRILVPAPIPIAQHQDRDGFQTVPVTAGRREVEMGNGPSSPERTSREELSSSSKGDMLPVQAEEAVLEYDENKLRDFAAATAGIASPSPLSHHDYHHVARYPPEETQPALEKGNEVEERDSYDHQPSPVPFPLPLRLRGSVKTKPPTPPPLPLSSKPNLGSGTHTKFHGNGNVEKMQVQRSTSLRTPLELGKYTDSRQTLRDSKGSTAPLLRSSTVSSRTLVSQSLSQQQNQHRESGSTSGGQGYYLPYNPHYTTPYNTTTSNLNSQDNNKNNNMKLRLSFGSPDTVTQTITATETEREVETGTSPPLTLLTASSPYTFNMPTPSPTAMMMTALSPPPLQLRSRMAQSQSQSQQPQRTARHIRRFSPLDNVLRPEQIRALGAEELRAYCEMRRRRWLERGQGDHQHGNGDVSESGSTSNANDRSNKKVGQWRSGFDSRLVNMGGGDQQHDVGEEEEFEMRDLDLDLDRVAPPSPLVVAALSMTSALSLTTRTGTGTPVPRSTTGSLRDERVRGNEHGHGLDTGRETDNNPNNANNSNGADTNTNLNNRNRNSTDSVTPSRALSASRRNRRPSESPSPNGSGSNTGSEGKISKAVKAFKGHFKEESGRSVVGVLREKFR